MNLLVVLTIHGALAFLLVTMLDTLLRPHVSAAGRRALWLLVPVAFLVSIPVRIPPHIPGTPIGGAAHAPVMQGALGFVTQPIRGEVSHSARYWLLSIWLVGMLIHLAMIAAQTRTAERRWCGERLSTDPGLLSLLEDCKGRAGVTAPIGLVVTDRLRAPAILGWLRPRILLPSELAASFSRSDLSAVLYHELAHFRALDVPMSWLLSLVRAIHWFNPFSSFAYRAWAGFREEAADEAAIGWIKDPEGSAYGDALIHALRHANGGAPPFGALAIGESIHNLTHRITMIKKFRTKSSHPLLTACLLLTLLLALIVRPTRADDSGDPKSAAVAAMQTWLKEIDQNQYAESWKDASPSFQSAITSDKWVDALNSVRTPLGSLKSRTLDSALHQSEIPGPAGVIKGDFVVAEFDASFDNLKYALETVCFEKGPDGSWKASGYYIKPK